MQTESLNKSTKSKVVKMGYESFVKQIQWGMDPKTIRALEKMKKAELKKTANKIANEAIEKIKGNQ